MAKKCSKGGARTRQFSVTIFCDDFMLRHFKSVRAGKSFWISDILCVFLMAFIKSVAHSHPICLRVSAHVRKGQKLSFFGLNLGLLCTSFSLRMCNFYFLYRNYLSVFGISHFYPFRKCIHIQGLDKNFGQEIMVRDW